MKTVVFVLCIIISMLLFFGLLFKLMHWPGAGAMMTGGWFFGGITAVLYLFYRYRNPNDHKLATYGVYFAFLVFAIGAVNLMMDRSVSGKILDKFSYLDNQLMDSRSHFDTQIYRVNKKIKELAEADTSADKNMQRYLNYSIAIGRSGEILKAKLAGLQQQLLELEGSSPDNYDVAKRSKNLEIGHRVLISNGKGTELRQELTDTYAKWKNIVTDMEPEKDPDFILFDYPFDPEPAPGTPMLRWEQYYFEGPLASIFPTLTAIELDIRQSELKILVKILNEMDEL